MSESSSKTVTEPNDWHQFFGMVFAHQTVHLPYTLEVDYNVDRTEQLIDILLRKDDPNAPQPVLPDGMENLRIHNLLTFKSFQETLDLFTVRELLLYGLLYQKMQAPKGHDILPDDEIGLYAVSTRYPRDLFKTQRLEIIPAAGVSGVYDVWYGPSYLRLIVIQELELESRNADFFLFSSREDQVKYGQENHNLKLPQFQFLVGKLLTRFNSTGGLMPKLKIPTMEEVVHEIFHDPTLDKTGLVNQIPDDLRLQGLPVTKRLEGLSEAELLNHVSPEKRLEGLSAEEILERLPPDQAKELAKLIAKQTKENAGPEEGT